MILQDFFNQNKKVALGFSGGVDSSYLLYAAQRAGAEIVPYYVKTAFQPEFEYQDALRVCKQLKVDMKVIELDVLQDESVTANPKNRCYYCKNLIFGAIVAAAQNDGFKVLLDGTNASDDVNDRAGFKAITEIGVLSPLRMCGLTKQEIRRLSKEAGLFTWDKPAYACLATRIPTGMQITEDMLKRVEGSENEMMDMGFSDFRVRVLENTARVQIKAEQMKMLFDKRDEILTRLCPFFDDIMLDLRER